jgi:DNA helicase-2/ATP-dependent DNA helicase PcrA
MDDAGPMDQDRIPSWAATSLESKQEQRRLFYVGLTRARHEVQMTFSGWTENRWGRRFHKEASEFLLEVQRKLVERG